MASFNQDPLGQASLVLAVVNLSLGSAADVATVNQSIYQNRYEGSENTLGVLLNGTTSSVRPAWRRGTKLVSARV